MTDTRRCLWMVALMACGASTATAQQPWMRDFAHLPPGVVGRRQVMRPGSPLRGYIQPVELRAPKGSAVSIAKNGRFTKPQRGKLKVGLLVGQVYRLRITRIQFRPGEEVYPTIELVNRLFPPEGTKLRFPVPVEFTQQELVLALRGRLVTRVVYLENPKKPLPYRQPSKQRYFDVGPKSDPLTVADRLGRPMAIMRMGSRIPDRQGITPAFLFGSPPVQLYSQKRPAKKTTGLKRRQPVVRIPAQRRVRLLDRPIQARSPSRGGVNR